MKSRSFFVNLSGIALALTIAFGGVFAVWSRLAEEKDQLLNGGGETEIPVQVQSVETQSVSVVEVDVTVTALTEDELCQAVLCLESTSGEYLHDPVPGQLSMTEAVEGGMAWLEEFFLPFLDGMTLVPKEYRMNCYLWAGQGDGGSISQDPLLGVWSVSFIGQGLEAELTLNAVTGQVLDAVITLPYQEEYPDEDSLSGLLENYADSFWIETNYVISGAQKEKTDGSLHEKGSEEDWEFHQRLENEEMAAVLDVDIAGSVRTDLGSGEVLRFHLYWETKAM